MKKLLMWLAMLPWVACAAELPEITTPYGMLQLAYPQGYAVLTRESSAADFRAMGLDSRRELAYMRDADIAAAFYPRQGADHEIVIRVMAGNAWSFDLLNEQGEAAACSGLRRMHEGWGYTVQEAVMAEMAGHRFVRITASVPMDARRTAYVCTYYTNQPGMAVWITLRTDGTPLTEEALAALRALADSMNVLNEEQK